MTITTTTRRTWVLALLVTGFFASYHASTTGQAQPSVVFIHVDVIDGTGAALKRNQNVVTSGGRITAIGDADRTSVPSGSRVVDASGKYLIPGLWDAHVHSRFEGVDHLRLFIVNGVTGFRDMGSPWEHFEVIKQWRREIAAGERIGPAS
jgi:predicted amidohydrolase YtcJ